MALLMWEEEREEGLPTRRGTLWFGHPLFAFEKELCTSGQPHPSGYLHAGKLVTINILESDQISSVFPLLEEQRRKRKERKRINIR